jgi:hypothetical protein
VSPLCRAGRTRSADEGASSVSLAVDPAVFPKLKRRAHDYHHHDQATEQEQGAHSSPSLPVPVNGLEPY